MAAYLSLTESQQAQALRSFLLEVLPDGVPVVAGQVNRVSEPPEDAFIVFWPGRFERLSTNVISVADNIITAHLSGNTLYVTSIEQAETPLGAGTPVYDTTGVVAKGTAITSQINGDPGGIGTYIVNKQQTVTSQTMYASSRNDLVPTQWTVQCDVHGTNGADNARIIEGLFRSEYGTQAFALSGFEIQPLYCDPVRQMPFINGEQQFEDRWTLDLVMQVNPKIETPQAFAAALEVGLIDVDVEYPPI